MKKIHHLLTCAAVLLVTALSAQAMLITPTSATASSEIASVDRHASHCIDGSGMSGQGAAGDTHAIGENGIVWTTNGSVFFPNDLSPEITFDLGAVYDVTKIREWGYNDPTVNSTSGQRANAFSPHEVEVHVSADGSQFDYVETVIFAKAPGASNYAGHEIFVNYSGVRYLKLKILSNHDGAVFDGTGTQQGPDGRSLTGLSEIRFEGSEKLSGETVLNPLPATDSSDIEPNAILSWDANDPENEVVSYQLVLGVGNPSYNFIVHEASLPRGSTESEEFVPPANVIQKDSKYWWRVDKVVGGGTITGPIWQFETRQETLEEKNTRMAWFRDSKLFGAIVWGLYSGAEGVWPPVTGSKSGSWTYAEWIQFWAKVETLYYRDTLEPYLTGTHFDAVQQAKLCKAAGMEMVYVMPRHHDGYAIWDTATSTTLAPNGFKITDSPFNPDRRDYLKELVDALRAEGLRVGFYFSLGDWHHPDFPHSGIPWAHPQAGNPPAHVEVWSRYVDYLHQQVKEIVDPNTGTDYGIFDAVYFDYSTAGIEGEAWGASKLLQMVRQHNPNVIVNNRLWNGLANPFGDYATPEANVNNIGYDQYGSRDWEAIMSANQPPTWGYGKSSLYPFKSAAQLVWNVVEVVAKGGTIELSVSPKADGSLHPDQITQYEGLGQWMDANGESIRGTSSNPLKVRPSWGEYTSKRDENLLYLHGFNRPADGLVLANGLMAPVSNARILANPSETLTLTQTSEGFQVHLPAELTDPINTVIVVDYLFPEAPPPATTSVLEVSSENVLGYDRSALHSVDSSGLSAIETHLVHAEGEDGIVWTTVGNLGPGTDYDPYIIYDLGAVADVTGIREWGYNASFKLAGNTPISIIGPDEVAIYTSVDGNEYTLAETVHFAQAPAIPGYAGNLIPVNLPGVRYIKLDIRTNHDGAILDGSATQGGAVDGRFLTGLSEIRFEKSVHANDSEMKVTAIRYVGTHTEVDVTGLNMGTRYQLTRSLNLTDGFPTVVDGPRLPVGANMTLIDSNPPSDRAFYRVEETE